MTGEGPIRIYVLDENSDPKCVASCEDDAVLFAIATLRDEGEIEDGDCVGILERRDDEETGRWLVNPWPPSPFGRRA